MFLLALKASIGILLFVMASLGIGCWISRYLATIYSQFDRLVFGLLGGFGLLSLALFLVGQFSFTRKSILIVLGLSIVASAKEIRDFIRHTSAIFVEALGNAPKIPLCLIALIVGMTGVVGLGEMTGDWANDTIAYHLLGPKVWLRNGVIRPVADKLSYGVPANRGNNVWRPPGDRRESSPQIFGLPDVWNAAFNGSVFGIAKRTKTQPGMVGSGTDCDDARGL
jgi:hypothetical protein